MAATGGTRQSPRKRRSGRELVDRAPPVDLLGDDGEAELLAQGTGDGTLTVCFATRRPPRSLRSMLRRTSQHLDQAGLLRVRPLRLGRLLGGLPAGARLPGRLGLPGARGGLWRGRGRALVSGTALAGAVCAELNLRLRYFPRSYLCAPFVPLRNSANLFFTFYPEWQEPARPSVVPAERQLGRPSAA